MRSEAAHDKAARLTNWVEVFWGEYDEALAEHGLRKGDWVPGSWLGMSGLAMNELAWEGYIDRDGNRYRP